MAFQARLLRTIIVNDDAGISTEAVIWLISMEGKLRSFSGRWQERTLAARAISVKIKYLVFISFRIISLFRGERYSTSVA